MLCWTGDKTTRLQLTAHDNTAATPAEWHHPWNANELMKVDNVTNQNKPYRQLFLSFLFQTCHPYNSVFGQRSTGGSWSSSNAKIVEDSKHSFSLNQPAFLKSYSSIIMDTSMRFWISALTWFSHFRMLLREATALCYNLFRVYKELL